MARSPLRRQERLAQSPPRVYLDSSVYLGILLGESLALPYLERIAGKALCSSTLLLIESERTLVRLSREGMLTPEDYVTALARLKEDRDLFILKDLSVDLCLSGIFPPVRLPRSSDLAHLRTALWLQEKGGLEGFLTLDTAQRSSALDLNLPVI